MFEINLELIEHRATGATLRIKTFDAGVLTGTKAAGVFIDELHEIARNPRASRIIGQLRGGMLANPESFVIFISTQADEPPSGVFKAELQTARSIRDGTISGSMLPILYEFPTSITKSAASPPAWYDPNIWRMVLPNLGCSITLDRLIADFEIAKTKGEGEIRRWGSQHLNLEVGLALHSDRWAGAEVLGSRPQTRLSDLDAIIERCDTCRRRN